MGKPIIKYEAGQTAYPFEALVADDSNMHFEASFSPWSNVSGSEPVVSPYGLLTGGAVTPHEDNDTVTVAALTTMMPGATGASPLTGVLNVSTDDLTAARASTSPEAVDQTHKITSLTVDDEGDLVAVPGAEGLGFSEVRGDPGGPPLIPDGSIEIGQVRRQGRGAGLVTQSEIYTVPGLHVERSDYPVYEIDYARGQVVFAEPLPLIHVGGIPKQVWARGATPLFSPAMYCSDWVPAEATFSVTSTDTYDGPVGSATSSLGQASFTAQLRDGLSDPIVQKAGDELWIEFRPDRDKTVPRQLTQGILGVSRTFPAGGGGFSGSFTLTARVKSVDVVE
jgi:hypothetical protein